jgi:uncharacterized membrane protein
MKDSIYLLLTALMCAGIAWAFWHFLGETATKAFVGATLLVTIGENLRLRRKVKALQAKLLERD